MLFSLMDCAHVELAEQKTTCHTDNPRVHRAVVGDAPCRGILMMHVAKADRNTLFSLFSFFCATSHTNNY